MSNGATISLDVTGIALALFDDLYLVIHGIPDDGYVLNFNNTTSDRLTAALSPSILAPIQTDYYYDSGILLKSTY